MPDDRERGAREREPPPLQGAHPQSALKNAVIHTAAFSALTSQQNNGSGLSQFSHKNIVQQRKNDISSERKEARVELKSHRVDGQRNLLVDTKLSVREERTAVIKQEFGSIANYNNFKNANKISSNRDSMIDTKKRLHSERNNLIKSEYGSHANYKEACSAINSENRRNTLVTQKKNLIQERNSIVKSGDTRKAKRLFKVENKIDKLDSQIKIESANIKVYFDKRPDEVAALKASGKRQDLSGLYNKSERLNKVDNHYSKLTNNINRSTAKLKTVTHTEMPEALTKIDRKSNYFDGKVNKCSDKLRQHSARLDNILTVRSDSKYYRASVDGHFRSSIDSADKFERKAAKSERKLDNISRSLPRHTIVRKSYQFNPETGKIKKKLILEKEVKALSGRTGIVTKALKGAGAVTALRLSQSIHGQLSKNENDRGNEGAKATHTALRFAENSAVKVARHTHKFLQERPYKKVSKLQMKSDKANAKLFAKRKGGTAKQMKKHAKQHINRAKQVRQAIGTTEKVTKAIAQAIKAVGLFLKKLILNPFVLKILAIIVLVLILVTIIVGVFMAVLGESGAILGAYLADDSEIHDAVNYSNTHSQTAVQEAINGVISNIPHDYVYIEPYSLGFNPYALISLLSAFSYSEVGDESDNSFTASDTKIQNAAQAFISNLYYISYATAVFTETVFVGYDDDGYPLYDTIEYTVLYIVVNQRSVDDAAWLVFNSGSPYTPAMFELYQFYMETYGFRQDLFPAWVN